LYFRDILAMHGHMNGKFVSAKQAKEKQQAAVLVHT
jgi:hypothetical protein